MGSYTVTLWKSPTDKQIIDLKDIVINEDDSIAIVYKKISYLVNRPWTNLYCWYDVTLNDIQKQSYIKSFINDIFQYFQPKLSANVSVFKCLAIYFYQLKVMI